MECNLKLILGLVWTLILRYQLGIGANEPEPEPPKGPVKGGASPSPTKKKKKPPSGAKKLLLGWIQATLPEQNVKNFTTDWNDGKNLSALVDRMKPGLIPDHASLDPKSGFENTKKAMDLAEEHLAIPQVLKPENLAVTKPDELSVITYLSYYCNKESPGKNSLLEWVNSKIPDQDIDNFTSDWKDGVALGCLTDVVSGGNFPDADEMDSSTPLENAEKAMDYAESNLGVPKVITPDQFVDPSLEALPMMTYLTHFRNAKESQFSTDVVTVTGPGISGGVAGQETNFIIKGRIPTWARLGVSVTSPSGDQLPVQKHGSGHRIVKCTYKPVVPGNHKVDVSINNDPVPHSPFTARHIEPTDSISCFAVGPGLDKARVGEKAEFSANCEKGGPGELVVEVQGPNGSVDAEVNEESGNVFSANFTPTEAGEHTIGVLWAEKHIGGSPFTCQVTDPKHCSAAGKGLTDPFVNQPNTFQVKTRGAGPGNLKVKMEDPDGTSVPITIDDTGSGTYNCTYTPTKKGDHTIDATWDDAPISGSPFHVYPKDAANASKCKAYDLPTGLLRADKEASFTVDVGEAGEGLLDASGNGPSLPAKCEVRKKDDDKYTVAFTPAEVGPTNVKVTFADESIPDSPFRFKVNDPTKCHVNKSAIEKGDYIVNQPIDFRVSAQFAGDGDVTATLNGPKGECKVDVKDQNDGTYHVHFVPVTPGNHGIDILFDGDQIPESPVRIFVDTDVPDVVVTEPAPGRLGAYIVDSPYVYKIDASGAREAKLNATSHGSRLGGRPDVKITDLGDKQYSVTLEAQTPDDYQVHIKWGETPVPNSPFSLPIVDKARPEKVIVSGPHYKVGSPDVSATVDASNAGAGELSATCTAMGSGSVPVAVTDKGDQVYDLALAPPPEECTLTVLWSEEQVPGSPFFIDLVAPDASKVRVTGPEYQVGSPIVTAAVDASKAGNGDLSAKCHGKKVGQVPVKINEKEKRVFDVEFESEEPDEFDLDITWSGTHVPRSPFTMDLRPSEADKVRIDGPNYHIGSPEVTATVDALQAGNGELTATCEGKNLGNVPVKLTEKEKGVFDVEVEASQPDDLSLGILWSGRHIPSSPFNIDTRPPEADKVKIDGPNYHIGSPEVTAAVDATEAGNGELSAKCRGRNVGDVPVKVTENDKGKFDIDIEASQPDDFDIDVLWSGEHVPNSPFNVDTRPSDADKVRVDGPNYHIGSPEVTATVDALQAGNGELTATCEGKNLGNVPVKLTEKEKGVFDVEVEASQPDDLTLGILWSGHHIPSSPFNVDTRPPEADKVKIDGPNYHIGSPKVTAAVDATEAGNGELSAKCRGRNVGDVPVKVTENDKGKFDIDIEASQPDDFDIDVLWSGEHVPNSPFNVDTRPSDADKVRVDGPNYHIGSPDVTAAVDATQAGNGKLSAKCRGKNLGNIPVKITEKEKGMFDVEVEANQPDDLTLGILWSGDHVPSSPFNIDTRPPEADKVRIDGPNYTVGSPIVAAAVDATQAGNGELSAKCRGKNVGDVPVNITEKDKGEFDVDFEASEPDEFSLDILWSGAHVPRSPFSVDTRPSEADKVRIDGPKYEVGSPEVTANVDASQAGTGDLTAACTGKKTGSVPVSIQPEGDHNYKLAIDAKESDEYSLDVLWSDRHIPGSPYSMDLRTPDASKVSVTEPDTYEVDSPAVYKIDASDAGVGTLSASCHYGKFGSIPVDVDEVSKNKFTATVTPKEPIDYNLSIEWSGEHVRNSPFKIHLVPDIYPEKVVCSELESSLINQPVFLTADATEAGPGKLTATCEGKQSGKIPVSVEEKRPSVYKVSFIPGQEDDYSLHVYFDDQSVPKSPFGVGIHPINESVQMELIPDVESTLEPLPLPPPVKEPELEMIIGDPLNMDLEQEPPVLDGSPAKVTANAVGDKVGRVDLKLVKDDTSDSYKLSFNPTQPDRYRIEVLSGDKPVPSSPIVVVYRRLFDSSKCFITDLPYGSSPPIVDSDIKFSVDATEAGKAELVIVGDGPSGEEPSHHVVTEEPTRKGYYRIKYTPTAPGDHQIHLTFGGDKIPGSPLLFSVASGSAISGVHVYQFGRPVLLHLQAEAKLRHIEAFASQEGTGNRVNVKVTKTKEKNKFDLLFTPKSPGFYDVHVFLSGARVAGCPYRIQYLPPPDPQKVNVSVTPSDIAYVREPIEFNIDAKEAGNADLVLRANVRKKRPEDFTVVNNNDGTYTGSYTPTVADKHKFDVTWSGKPVSGSPFYVTVVHRPPDISHLLTNDLNLIQMGSVVDVHFDLANKEDQESIVTQAKGKNVGDVDWKLQSLDEDQKFRAHFNSATPDDYVLEIKFNDNLIEGSPYFVKVVGMGALEPTMPISDVDVPSIVDVGEPVNFLLKTDLENVHADDVDVHIDGPDYSESPDSTVKGDMQGMYAIKFTPEQVGDYLVHVKHEDEPVVGSPFRITAQQSKASADKCHVVADDLPLFAKAQRFGKPCKFRISTNGAGRGTLNITTRGPGKAEVKIFDEGEGIYSCELTPSVAGTYNVDITWDDEMIQGSPYQLTFKNKKKKVITGLNLEAEHFRLGVPHRFKLHCDDLGTGILEVKSKPSSASKVKVVVADKNAYQVELVPVEEGHHEVSVQYNGTHIAGSPFNVTFNRKGDASKCHMVRSEVEQNEAGEDIVVFVVSTEGAGPGRLTSNVENVRGGESPAVEVKELDTEYTFKVEFLLGDGTEYMLNIKYDNEHIDGSPFKLLFDPKPNPEACRADGDGLKTSIVGKEAEFDVKTVGAGQGELTVTIANEEGDTIEPTVTNADDYYHCSYTPKKQGDYEISVKWGDGHIPSSPFKMRCYSSTTQHTPFSVVEPPSSILLGEDIVFNIKTSEEVEGDGDLTVSAESGTQSINGTATYEGFGSYHCKLTPSEAGKYTVKVCCNGENIEGSPFKVKVGLPPRPDLVKAYGPGLQDGFVGQEGNFTLETGEAGSGTLAVRLHGPKGAFKINMRHHPDNERTILVRYDPKYTGEYTIDVTWADKHIPDSPFKVNIQEQKQPSDEDGEKEKSED